MGSHAGSLIGNEIYVVRGAEWRWKGNILLPDFFLNNRLLCVIWKSDYTQIGIPTILYIYIYN